MPYRMIVWSGVLGLSLSVLAGGALVVMGLGNKRCVEPRKPMVHNQASLATYRFQMDEYEKCVQKRWTELSG